MGLKSTVSPSDMETWFSRTALKRIDEGTALIEVPNKFVAKWLHDNYLTQIQHSFYKTLRFRPEIEFIHEGAEAVSHTTKHKNKVKSSLKLNKYLNQSLTFSSFITEKNNRFAYALASQMANKTQRSYDLLFIFSKECSGKTHLLHAIGNQAYQNDPSSDIIYTSLEKFWRDFSVSKKKQAVSEFREKYNKCQYLLIDDIHQIGTREKLQKELVPLIDHFIETKGNIALASKLAPAHIDNLLPELKSRFEGGFISELPVPDHKTRIRIIKKKAKMEKISIPEDAAFFLANSTGDLKILIHRLISLATYSSLHQRPITISIIKSLVNNRQPQETNINEIQDLVADHFNISVPDLLSNKKIKKYSYPRHMAMYLARQITGLSLKDIAKSFGNRDHSTVIYAVKQIDKSRKEKKEIAEDLKKLERLLSFSANKEGGIRQRT